MKSIGFATLDNCAVQAFAQCRWKPHTWIEVVMPITYEMAAGPRPLPKGAIRLRQLGRSP
jgi:hypothetical protein